MEVIYKNCREKRWGQEKKGGGASFVQRKTRGSASNKRGDPLRAPGVKTGCKHPKGKKGEYVKDLKGSGEKFTPKKQRDWFNKKQKKRLAVSQEDEVRQLLSFW